MKPQPKKLRAAAVPPKKPRNPQLDVQTRKVLKQHYRAKYGVR